MDAIECAGPDLRSGDDDLGINKLLVELGVLAFLVRCGNEGVALILEPLADAELVLGGAQQLRDLLIIKKMVGQLPVLHSFESVAFDGDE